MYLIWGMKARDLRMILVLAWTIAKMELLFTEMGMTRQK